MIVSNWINMVIAFFSLLFLVAIADLSPVYLQAADFRAANSSPLPQQGISDQNGDDIRDIIGPVDLPEPPPYLLYTTTILIIILVSTVLFFLVIKKKKQPPPLPDPATEALEALSNADTKLAEHGTSWYIVEISSILRSYIEAICMIPTTRQTTIEFFNKLKTADRSAYMAIKAHRERIGDWLQLCDMAKFAHYLPENDRIEQLSGEIRAFIEETRKKEETV